MLHVEHYGEGPELMLLHGWAMHGAVFSDWTRLLGEHFRVTVVDLPGHGHSREAEPGELAQWAEAVLEVAPARAAWIGWSLGGLVALAAAGAAPERFRALVLLASTPRFVTCAGWQTAVDAQVFDQFAGQLDASVERTLSRFMALQVRG
ncbi:MAG: alpha/beta fold hydrolase, partial [Thiogranum sp.]|nr:alpha/beta fold hydrolase [Thiogranum sp.]